MNAKDFLTGTLTHPSLKGSKPLNEQQMLKVNCVSEVQHVDGSEDASDYCQCQHGSCLPGTLIHPPLGVKNKQTDRKG